MESDQLATPTIEPVLGITFLLKGDRCALALVRSFDGHRYRFSLYGPEDGKEHERCVIDLDDPISDGWHAAALPSCCVCLAGKANRFLQCRCTAPCVCTTCATRVRACPVCRERVHGLRECEQFLDACEARSPNAPPECGDNRIWNTIMRNRFPLVHAIETPYCASKERTQIFVKSATGRIYTLHVCLEWTICMLKTMVYYVSGFSPHDQRLIYAGRGMDIHPTLADYKIVMDFTLHLVLHLRGD